MNPYVNHNLNELITAISTGAFIEGASIKEVCEITPQKITTERESIYVVRALRKSGYFDEAYKFHEELKTKYPNSDGLKSEELWLTFSSKVCDGSNKDYLKDAQSILNETSQEDLKTNLIYEITAIITLSRLIRDYSFEQAYALSIRVNPLTLSDKGRIGENDQYYPSNKQQFYEYKAKSLIGQNKVNWYLNWVFQHLKFTEQKHEEFVTEIIKSCTIQKNDGTTFISDRALGNYLYKFDIDLISSIKYLSAASTSSNSILLSELSQYLFCPASFAINRSFNIPGIKPIDSSSKWSGSKDGFYDRYLLYQKKQNIKSCFEYYPYYYIEGIPNSIILEEESSDIFEELFKGSIKTNNHFDTAPQTFKSDDGKLIGAPDYLVELTNGQLVVVAEKFSSISSAGASKIYNSDIIALEAYLTKFKHLKIDHAYFINWTWSIEKIPNGGLGPDTNKLYINKVNIKSIDLEVSRELLVDQTTEKINSLKSGNKLKFADLGFANKCLNCSVYSYCEHKSGTNNSVGLPYGSW